MYVATVSVGLDTEAKRVGVSVADHVAMQDANLRKRVAYWTIGTFIGANLLTLFALGSWRGWTRPRFNSVLRNIILRQCVMDARRNTGKTPGSRGYQAGCPRQWTSSDSGGTTMCPGTLSRLPR